MEGEGDMDGDTMKDVDELGRMPLGGRKKVRMKLFSVRSPNMPHEDTKRAHSTNSLAPCMLTTNVLMLEMAWVGAASKAIGICDKRPKAR